MRPFALLGVIALAALAWADVGSSIVKRISITSPVEAGERAALTVMVTPKARCTGMVASEPRAQRLPAKSGGRITWHWKIDPSTRAGTWPIVVTCAESGVMKAAIVVHTGPELPLLDAAKIVCNRTPARFLKRFPRLAAAHVRVVPNGLALNVGTTSTGPYYGCGFFIETAQGARPADYSATITRTARCVYTVRSEVGVSVSSSNTDWSALRETYTETCASLR